MSNSTSKRLRRVWALVEKAEADYSCLYVEDVRAALEGGAAWAVVQQRESQIKESQ